MINWGMGGPQNNALQYFQFGNQLGSQLRERQQQEESRKASLSYAADPSEKNFNAMLGYMKPEQMVTATEKRQEQRRADLPLIGRLLDHAQDEPTYQQSIQIAQQYGIDTSTLPPNYNPARIGEIRNTVKMLQDPAKMEALSTYGKIATDQLGPDKVGTPEWRQRVTEIWQASEAKPYTEGGNTRLYTPKLGGVGQVAGPKPGDVEEGYRFKGGNPADRNSWEPVTQGGGGASRVTSNFLDGF